jgi:hypothetical protein
LIPKRGKDFCPSLIDSLGMEVDESGMNLPDLFAKEEVDGKTTMKYNANEKTEEDDPDARPKFNKLFYLAGLEYLDWQENNFDT